VPKGSAGASAAPGMRIAGGRRKSAVKTMTERSRLLLLVTAALVPALGLACWLIGNRWEEGRERQESQAREHTRSAVLAIERELNPHAALARVLAASPWLDQAPSLSASERAAFEQTARRATAGSPLAVQLLGADALWLDTRRPQEPPRRQPGAVPALSPRPAVLLQPARAAGEQAYVALVEPVRRNADPPAWNLRVLLPLAQLQAVLDRTPLPPGGSGWLLDARGEPVLRHAQGQGQALPPDAALPGFLRQSLGGRSEGRLSLQNAEGEALRVHFSRSPMGWTYARVVPRASLDAALLREVWGLALGAMLPLALAVGLGWWVARAELRRRVAEAVARTQRNERWAAKRERTAALGRLTGRVAHEFNNLLGIISNSAHLIQRHADSPALSMPVAATLRAVDGASRLTQHLLRFGGRQNAQARTVALGEWLPGLREMLGVVLGKRIALAIEVPDAPLYTRVDPDELELAIINLALNAREVLPEGGHVGITAGLAPASLLGELPPGPYVFITVRDDGPGLDAAQARRAFEPFFTTKDGDAEAGFGLSQVHGLCAQAGGRALIWSQPEHGTAVSLVLPAVAPESSVPERAQPEPAAPLQARVLLTEDNDALSDVTAALIENMGASVERATHAAQALQRLERGPAVDVVLTDVSMPGDMDGLGLARAVRARWPRVRVVLISAYGKRLPGAENFTVLSKPCAPQTLLAALKGSMGTPHAP